MQSGIAAKVRAYVAANPGTSCAAIATALETTGPVVSRILWRLVSSGALITHEGPRYAPHRYEVAPAKPRKAKPRPSKTVRNVVSLTILPKQTPITGERESIEHFLARGGQVQRLEARWENPTHYPPLDASVSRRGAHGAAIKMESP